MKDYFFFLFLVTYFLTQVSCLILFHPNGSKLYFPTPISYVGTRNNFIVTAPIFRNNMNTSGCDGFPFSLNNTAIMEIPGNCYPNVQAKYAQDNSALVVIRTEFQDNTTLGPVGKNYDTSDGSPSIDIGVVLIGYANASLILDILNNYPNVSIYVEVSSFDPNPWVDVAGSAWLIIVTCIDIMMGLAALGFSIYKCVIFLKYDAKLGVPQITLFCITLGIAWLVIVDIALIGSGATHVVLHSAFTYIGIVLSETFFLIGSVVVSLYWIELLKFTRSNSSKNLQKLFIPLIIAASILGVLIVLVIVLTVTIPFSPLIIEITLVICYVIIGLSISILWLIVGIIIAFKLRKHKKEMIKLSILIIISGILRLSILIFFIILIIPNSSATIDPVQNGITSLLFGDISILSGFIQLLSFNNPLEKKSKSKSMSKTKSNSKLVDGSTTNRDNPI